LVVEIYFSRGRGREKYRRRLGEKKMRARVRRKIDIER